MKKLVYFLLLLFFLFIIFLLFRFLPNNYIVNYKINNINIVESFDKSKNIYSFLIKTKTNYYEYYINNKYINKRQILDKIKEVGNCIYVKSSNLSDFSICNKNNSYFSDYVNNQVKSKKYDEYHNIKIFDNNNSTFFIWNYNGFIKINNILKEEIKLFDKEEYNIKLVSKINDYLFVANYNNEYKFNNYFLINKNNGEIKNKKIDRFIYYNSYILGTYKNNIYIYDMETENEYELNPIKSKFKKISYGYYDNDEWIKTSRIKLNNKKISFVKNNDFDFYLDDNNKLYYKCYEINILLSNMEVSKILEENDEYVYFISGDTLYYLDLNDGIKKIMSYSEWNFNYQNIYVFDNN